ncbi:hypothetical protein NP233_g9339 [Leucocoprinus birnbaumii]|uniref:NodB homology domain-containing protein n=1 Tax=Leucocoprinus birnbaumii TaxID=56174 RepID=A0AAD5YNA3_9AGAR|nr:hypothetical protein NP233_g9339 [Leucocoprinus birnbaumii]
MMMFTTVAAIILLATFANAAPYRRQNTTSGVVTSCTKPGTAALTFDDGPYNFSGEIVQLLNQHNVKGTFFYTDIKSPLILGVTLTFPNYLSTKASYAAIRLWVYNQLNPCSTVTMEMAKIREALIKVAGVDPAFMRPPYGEYNDNVLQVAQQLGEIVVTWDFDSGDSIGADPNKQLTDYDALTAKRPSSVISLEHETIQTSAETVLPAVIQKLQAAGYQLVTVAECLGIEPYKAQGVPYARDVNPQLGPAAKLLLEVPCGRLH